MYKAIMPLYSLTQDPRKYKFKQPAQINNFDEIVEFYIERISREDVLDDIIAVLEDGLPLENLTKLIVRLAVMEGIHSIENGFLVRPLVYEYVKGLADEAGITYKEKFSNKAEKEEKQLRRAASRVKKSLRGREEDEGFELLMSAAGAATEGEMPEMTDGMASAPKEEEEKEIQEPAQMEMDLGDREEQRPAGLMARG